MAKKNYEFTLEERTYIHDQENYEDTSKNVFMLSLPQNNKYTIFAKPVAGSKGSYVFPQDNQDDAYFTARALMDKSQGYSFEVRNKRVLCKPTTSKATIVLDVDGSFYAHAIVKDLRRQEVINNIKYNANKGFSLIKKMISENLTEDELYESLFDTIDETIENDRVIVTKDKIFYDAKSAKRYVARNDFNREIEQATEKYEEKIDEIGC